MTSIPITIKNSYTASQYSLVVYYSTYYKTNNVPTFYPFTETIYGGQTYYGSAKSSTVRPNYAIADSQVYIFYYDNSTGNYGVFQSIYIPPNASSVNITLVNNCGVQRSISPVPNDSGTLNIQLSYISNNINSYVRPITCSYQEGCWIYGAPSSPDAINSPYSPNPPNSCICIDTDSLQADINSGVIGC